MVIENKVENTLKNSIIFFRTPKTYSQISVSKQKVRLCIVSIAVYCQILFLFIVMVQIFPR